MVKNALGERGPQDRTLDDQMPGFGNRKASVVLIRTSRLGAGEKNECPRKAICSIGAGHSI